MASIYEDFTAIRKNFTHIGNNIRLIFTLQCDIVQYMKEESVKSLLVISTTRFMIFRIEGDG